MGISVIFILAGGIGMMNTLLMLVFERTREIGVLRALAWRRRWVIEPVDDVERQLAELKAKKSNSLTRRAGRAAGRLATP